MTERITLPVEQMKTAAQQARVFQMTSCFAQLELAYFFEVRQPLLSNAKRQDAVPSGRLRPLYLQDVDHGKIICTAPSQPALSSTKIPLAPITLTSFSRLREPVTRPFRAVFLQRLTDELRCRKAQILSKPVLQNFM